MYTKEYLDRLRASRPKRNKVLNYTIGGTIETQVHSNVEAERIGELNRGDRAMNTASQRFKDNILKTRKGLAKAQFKSRNERER